MNKGGNIIPEQRKQVQFLRKNGKSYRQSFSELKISRVACFQTMKYIERFGTRDNIPHKIKQQNCTNRKMFVIIEESTTILLK